MVAQTQWMAAAHSVQAELVLMPEPAGLCGGLRVEVGQAVANISPAEHLVIRRLPESTVVVA